MEKRIVRAATFSDQIILVIISGVAVAVVLVLGVAFLFVKYGKALIARVN